ncbi:MAG: ArsC family (seleno)protein [Nannocystaceae bacterium]
MDARQLEATEKVSASRKLGRDDAEEILRASTTLLVAKGKKVSRWSLGKGKTKTIEPEAIDAMLGPTGNLRAPTIRVGSTVVVGFHDDLYTEVFGEG